MSMHRRKFEGFFAPLAGVAAIAVFTVDCRTSACLACACNMVFCNASVCLTWLSIAAVVAASFCREPCEDPSQKLTTVANAAAKAPTVILMIWAT